MERKSLSAPSPLKNAGSRTAAQASHSTSKKTGGMHCPFLPTRQSLITRLSFWAFPKQQHPTGGKPDKLEIRDAAANRISGCGFFIPEGWTMQTARIYRKALLAAALAATLSCPPMRAHAASK